MVEAHTELMTFDRGALSARVDAQAHATAVARADLRRGLHAEFQAEAGASLQARLDATPDGTHAGALLSAEVSAGVRGALAAQLDVQGLFAEAALGAEARARVRGEVSLTGEVLFAALDADLPPHVARPARALLRQATLHAGVFAEIYLAVKAQARLQVGGSLIPADDSGSAGITVNFRYGYAWIYGAGAHGYADLEFPDAAAAVDALVQEVLVVLDENLPADAPRELRTALRVLLPLAASSAIAVGRDLGAPRPTTEPAGADLSRIAASFLRQLRSRGLDHLLEALLRDAAERAVSALLELASVPVDRRWVSLADEVIADARRAVALLRSASSVADALPPLVHVCGSLARLGDGTVSDPLGPLTSAATTAAVAGTLLLDVLGRPTGTLPPAVVSRIREQLQLVGLHVPGSSGSAPEPAVPLDVTMTVLVEYLLSVSGQAGDEVLRTLDAVGTIVGRAPEALIRWLWDLGDAGKNPQADLAAAQAVTTALVDGVQKLVRPWVEGLPPGDLRDIAGFVAPLLEIVELALPAAMTPGLTGAQASRLRDELDTQLTQLVGTLVIRVLDRVVRPWFRMGAEQLRELAERVDRRDPAFAEFFAIANDVSVVFRIDEIVVETVLRETADILSLVETAGFDSALGLLQAFVLLPESVPERRAQLAALAGTDAARIGDAALSTRLLQAMVVDSLELAIGMIPPSIRVSTVIALQQGPVPLLSVASDAVRTGAAIASAVEKARAVGSDLAQIIAGLVERGRVRAEDLVRLAVELKAFIHALREVVDAILHTLREALWPVWVASTGGLGLLARGWYDQLFDSATGVVDRLERELDVLADAMVAAAARAAQGLGILDEGSGDDLGQLGQSVRQAALGGPGDAGIDVSLGPGTVAMSRAELATHVTNGAFADDRVRTRLRGLHRGAVDQATDAAQIQTLRGRGRDSAQAAGDLEAQLASMSLPSGAAIDIAVEGLPAGSVVRGAHTFTVSVPGRLFALVSGPTSLVRIEVGGVLVVVDPRIWGFDERGRVRCRVRLVCQTPVTTSPIATPTVLTEAVAVHRLRTDLTIALGTDRPPVPSVRRPIQGVEGDLAPAPRAADFLPWAMTQTGLDPVIVPTVLAADVAATPATARLSRQNVGAVGVPPVAGFVSSLDIDAVATGPGGIGLMPRMPQRDPDPDHGGGGGGTGGTGTGGTGTGGTGTGGTGTGVGAPGSTTGGPPPGLPFAAVALVPPGFVTVTAAVCAVPATGQSPESAPRSVTSTWCVVQPEAE